MSLPRSYFPVTNEMGLEVGQRVEYIEHGQGVLDALAIGHGRASDGAGTIMLIWLCLDCEAVKIANDEEQVVSLFPELGDLIWAID